MLETFTCVQSSSGVIKLTRYEIKFIFDHDFILLAIMIAKIIRGINQNTAFDCGKRAKLQRPILR